MMNNALRWHVVVGGFLAYMFDAVEISILAISLPSIRQSTGISLFESGLLATIGWVAIGISGLAMGVVADNYGRRRALLLSLLVFGVATFAFAFSAHSLALMLGLRFTAGLGLGGVWAILAAYVAETWPEQMRSRVTLLVLSSYPVGAMLAAAVGGLLLPDWQSVFLAGGAAALIPFAYIFFLIPESPAWLADREHRRATHAMRHAAPATSIREIFEPLLLRQTIFGTAAASFALFAYIGLLTWLPSYLTIERQLMMADASRYIIIFNIGVFASYFLFGLLADTIGERRALILSLTGIAIMLAVYSRVSDTGLLLWLSPLMGIFIVFSGLMGSYFSRIYPIHIRATGAGFCFNVGRGVASLSPVLTAGIASTFGYATALTTCAGIFLLAVGAVTCLPSEKRRRGAAASSQPAMESAMLQGDGR